MTVQATPIHRPRWISTGLFIALLWAPVPALAEGAHGEEQGAGAHEGAPAAHAAEGHDTAHGGGHGAEGIENWISLSFGPGKKYQNGPFFFAIFNFAVLVWLLVRYGKRPFLEFLSTRHTTIRESLAEAAQLRDEARRKLDAINGKLKHLEQEIDEIKAHVAQDAQLEKERIIAEAHAQADLLVRQAEKALDKEIASARRRLETEAVSAAMQAAEKLIRQQINEADRKRINEEYFAELSSGGRN